MAYLVLGKGHMLYEEQMSMTLFLLDRITLTLVCYQATRLEFGEIWAQGKL